MNYIIKQNKNSILWFFIIYIVSTMFLTFLDKKNNFNGILLVIFFVTTILVLKSKDNQDEKLIKKNTWQYFNIIFFTIGYSLFYNLLVLVYINNQFVSKHYDFSLSTFYILFLFPILEELIFRRKFLNLLSSSFSIKKAITILAIGITSCHIFSDSGLLPIFIFNIFLSWSYLKTKNILLCVFCHILNNFLILYFIPTVFLPKENNYFFIIFFILSSFLMMVFSIYKFKKS